LGLAIAGVLNAVLAVARRRPSRVSQG